MQPSLISCGPDVPFVPSDQEITTGPWRYPLDPHATVQPTPGSNFGPRQIGGPSGFHCNHGHSINRAEPKRFPPMAILAAAVFTPTGSPTSQIPRLGNLELATVTQSIGSFARLPPKHHCPKKKPKKQRLPEKESPLGLADSALRHPMVRGQICELDPSLRTNGDVTKIHVELPSPIHFSPSVKENDHGRDHRPTTQLSSHDQ